MRSRGQRHRLYRNATSGRRPAVGTPLTILGSSLIAYWTLDEASGTRNDSHTNALHLTDNNTVTQAAGRVGNAAQFTSANSESLSRASEALLQTGDIDFTFAAWVYFTDATTTNTVAGKGTDLNTHEWCVFTSGSNLYFRVENNGAQKNVATALSNDTWYFVVAWHDAAADTINIQVNNGAAASLGYAGGITAAAGAMFLGGVTGAFSTMLGDEAFFCKRVLTDSEKAWLYAYGGGA